MSSKNWGMDLITEEHVGSTGKCILSSKYLIQANSIFKLGNGSSCIKKQLWVYYQSRGEQAFSSSIHFHSSVELIFSQPSSRVAFSSTYRLSPSILRSYVSVAQRDKK